jgi:hypothetical protein
MDGNYQNYIDALPNLELYRYENIFKVYQTKDGNNDYFYNIIKNIQVPQDINYQIFDTIALPHNTALPVLSYQLYGTTYLWWLICVVNNIQNPFDNTIYGKDIKVIKKQYIKIVLDAIKQQLQ